MYNLGKMHVFHSVGDSFLFSCLLAPEETDDIIFEAIHPNSIFCLSNFLGSWVGEGGILAPGILLHVTCFCDRFFLFFCCLLFLVFGFQSVIGFHLVKILIL